MDLRGNLALNDVRLVEELALHAWPGLEVTEVNGWLVRHASGITRRANSVWPNAWSGTHDLDAAVASIEAFYHSRDLPARFQICPAALPDGVDDLLAQRGYQAVARTAVQTASLEALTRALRGTANLPTGGSQIELMAQPSALWWECYAQADELTWESVAVRKKICAAIPVATVYALLSECGEAVAVGSAAVEAGWIGFFNIGTVPGHRRRGAARAVMAALLEWGQTQGAKDAYLQVMVDNLPAQRMYEQLGFSTGYYYHYREAPWRVVR